MKVISTDVRIPESLYNFQLDNKQVFVENHLANTVYLNAKKRVGSISCVEPVTDNPENARNLGLHYVYQQVIVILMLIRVC